MRLVKIFIVFVHPVQIRVIKNDNTEFECQHIQSHRFGSEFAVLLELRHQSQHLLRSLDDFILQVGCTVSAGLL